MSRRSRRELLRTAGVALTAGVAGCVGGGGQSSPTADADVIRDTSVDGKFLVVELSPEHEVSRLNLIGPDGSAYAQSNVAAGETRAKLELLSIQPEPALEHYLPGEHKLVAVHGDAEVSEGIKLRPRFELSNIRQNRDPEYESQLGNLVFTIRNTGSGPSWVYDIAFDGAPYYAANSELSGRPGVPFMTQPKENSEFVIGPGDSQEFVSSNPPFIFRKEDDPSCVGEYELTAIIGFPTEEPLKVDILAKMDGDPANIGSPEKHTCSKIDVKVGEIGTVEN